MTGRHPIEATDISTIFTVCIRTQMPPPQAASRKRLHKFPPARPPALSAPAQAVSSILCRAPTFPRRIHPEVMQEYYECYKCHYVQNLGTYVYKDHGSGSYGSWTCPDCGSHTWVLDYENDATCTRNGYREYSCDCGQSKRETIYATGHSYSYGSWEQYSSIAAPARSLLPELRRFGLRICQPQHELRIVEQLFGTVSIAERHPAAPADTPRRITEITATLPVRGASIADTQHRRSKTCSGCGASTYDYANHSYSYGSWVSDSETQHKRTKTCSACGDSGYEYADHTDANGDGKCDDCGATVSLTVTVGRRQRTAAPSTARPAFPKP